MYISNTTSVEKNLTVYMTYLPCENESLLLLIFATYCYELHEYNIVQIALQCRNKQ